MRIGNLLGTAALGLALAGCGADDPFSVEGPASCEVEDQNAWVYDRMQEIYLWADELPSVEPRSFESPETMLREIRYAELDRWSRISDRAQTTALFQEGKVIAFGFRTRLSDTELRIASVHLDSPAGHAGLRRGDRILSIDGMTIEEISEAGQWGEIYGPTEPGVTLSFEVATDEGQRTIELTKDWITMQTVPDVAVLDRPGGPIGYLLLTSFVNTSTKELDAAFETFRAAGAKRVVIDLRYNGGGLISVARDVMNLLIGRVARGETAFEIQYAPALADSNVRRKLEPRGSSLDELEHVVFVVTGATASASELVVNAVVPHVRVSMVGSKTAGKPVGSRQLGFCDKVMAAITFRLVNAIGFGDYFAGFEPDCAATDDLDRQLADPGEEALREAIAVLETGGCSPIEPGDSDADDEPPESRSPESRIQPRESLRTPDATMIQPGSYPHEDALRGLY